MKKIILSILFVSCASSAAFASYNDPLLVRTETTALAPTFQTVKKCEIFLDKVVKTLSAGNLTTIQNTPSDLQNPTQLTELIEEASKGPFTTHTGRFLGAPKIFWSANQLLPNDGAKSFDLGATGNTVISTTNEAAKQLINFANLACN